MVYSPKLTIIADSKH
jgi:hypothetical protein